MPKARDMKLPVRPWFTYERERVSNQLAAWCQANELMTYKRRYRNMTLYRLTTGQDPPVVMGLWQNKRVASAMYSYQAEFEYPSRNIVSAACDTLENRIGTVQPFVQHLPKAADFEVREACREADAYVESVFYDNRYYDLQRVVFRDCFMTGMGIVKVIPSNDNKSIVIERCVPDEILVDEIATLISPPTFIVQRRYMTRYDAMQWLGDDPAAEAAIRVAQSAFIGISGIKYDGDMIALLEAWVLPSGDNKGRHVLATENYCFVDEEWKRDKFPFAVMRWSPQSLGWWSVGGAFAMAPVQIELNNKWEQIIAAQRAMAYPRWLVQRGSDVSAKTLGARPGALHFYTGAEPKPITPIAANAEMYQDAADWERVGYSLVGLTQQQVQGSKQPGINSGTAVRLMVDVEDNRNKSRVQALEGLVRDVAELVIDTAVDINPPVAIGGERVKWNDISSRLANHAEVRAFPVSSLPSTPEAAQEQVSEWYADGVIDSRAYFRLQQMPDTVSFARLTTASADLISSQLDDIVRSGKYVAPEPTIDDVNEALRQSTARYNLEKRLGTDDSVLRQLAKYISAVKTLQPVAQPAMAPTPPAAIGGPGAPIAPPPVQVQPSIPNQGVTQ